jgi:hypothetical protein
MRIVALGRIIRGRRAHAVSLHRHVAPYVQAIAIIDIAELAAEIGFLVGHDAVVDDECEGHQHY